MKIRAILLSILLGISTPSWADGPSLLVLGKSFHFGGNTSGLNGTNPGIGAEYAWGPTNGLSWFSGALTYYDSYRHQAYAGYAGVRYSLPLVGGTSAFASLRAGYINGSGFHGPMVLPTVGIQYRNVALEVMYIPKVNNRTVNVIGLFGRWDF